MRKVSIILAALVACAATAGAQTAPAGVAPRSYYGVVSTGVTAGHKVGGLFNVEVGRRINESWDLALEFGRMTDTQTAELETAASVITTKVLGTGAASTAKQPVNSGAAGIRYKFPTSSRMQPYAGVGVGYAKVTKNVAFSVNGNDVTSALLTNYGVQLGTDLSGSENKAMATVVVGAHVPLRGSAFADVSYRFGRIFVTDGGLNTNRVQVGIGVRF